MRWKNTWLSVLLIFLFGLAEASRPCAKRVYPHPKGEYTFGCVCNATYCDDIVPLGDIKDDFIAMYVSDREQFRLNRFDFHFVAFPNTSNIIKVDATRNFQEIMGFGGAITDSVGLNLLSLSKANQDQIMNGYYSKDGLEYTFTRTPMASCDFSTHQYSFDDVDGDMDLVHFNLTKEDFQLKIPFLKQARELTKSRGVDLKFFTTAWSSPGWMKTTDSMKGGGALIGEVNGPYYQTWAKYYIRFFEEYHKQGIDFWGLTPGNEPSSGVSKGYHWQALFFDPETQRDFIKGLLGPALKANNITKNLKLMIGDDQRFVYPVWADVVLTDPEAAKYVDGFAVHWYEDWLVPDEVLKQTLEKHPGYFMMYTEACNGYLPWEGSPIMGDWRRADMYAYDIITDLKSGVQGWVDWNLCLDPTGGPNFAKNNVDAPIIVNATADEFIRQPMYYALGHFSKFVKPGFRKIELYLPENSQTLEGVAFASPDGVERVLILLNRDDKESYDFTIQDVQNPRRFGNVHIEPMSLRTFIWRLRQ